MSAADGGNVDVAVVGAGPTGLVAGLLLARAGLHVVVFEREHSTVCDPRAVTLDDESLRTFAVAGVLDEIRPLLLYGYGTRWYAGNGKPFAAVSANAKRYGFPLRSGFSQPEIVAILARRYVAAGGRLLMRCAVQGITQHGDGVRVAWDDADGRRAELTARYAIAADGANSAIRTDLGIVLEGLSHAQPWLIVDTVNCTETARYSRFYCGSPRPYVAVPGRDGRMRYEFMLLPGEDPEKMRDSDTVRELLQGHRDLRDDDIVRIAPYRFHSRVAPRWREGRIFLAGDAAHLMPPFAGQGMNSGIRDASNLAWKLEAAVRGVGTDTLLDSYQAERLPHVRAMLRLSEAIGAVVMSRGAVAEGTRRVVLWGASKVPGLREYVAEMRFKPRARFARGFVVHDRRGRGIAGTLAPNPLLMTAEGREQPLDALCGPGFALVAFDHRGTRRFPLGRAAISERLGVARILVLPGEQIPYRRDDGVTVVADLRNELAVALRSAVRRVLLLRPDRVVAAAFQPNDVAAAEQALEERGIRPATPEPAGRKDVPNEIISARKC
ncbi:MAG: bifunctional 3-(3-hydroxy-phenyl)propionate/3-hydroxycinnamic acid hydroxylase [Candidatus Eremiobacteraeota bacterium]|nr:bifunctional 3-(3-hydroxy-phenyl)propionate/3-hydroxycinnamic acid hydroxylase [Candidatus Eremiobacteraeota bacterium]